MKLSDLIQGLDLEILGPGGATEVRDLTDDSREVEPGFAFIARRGTKNDGRAFVPDAIRRGAVAIIADHAPPVLPDPEADRAVAWAQGPAVDQVLAGQLAERLFDHPGRRLKLIGITGTNGKTTTAFILQHLLREAGMPCGMIGTVLVDDGLTRRQTDLTTPSAIELSRWLAAMVANGCQAAVAEFSSHGLHQGRASALDLDVGVFTNLTADHLDYHQTMEQYADAKALLFEQLQPDAWALVNADDCFADRMVRDCRARVLRCAVRSADAPQFEGTRATILGLDTDHSRARFDGPWGSVEVKLPLVGRHNVANAMMALAAANCITDLGRSLRKSLATCPAPPGRLEPVRIGDRGSGIWDRGSGIADLPEAEARPKLDMPVAATSKPKIPDPKSQIPDPRSEIRDLRSPTVLVDYAHTPDALQNVLLAVRPLVRGRLVVLFGCGGDRDATKRPKMGAIACRLADRVIITSDNPRTEDPGVIIDQILRGVPDSCVIRDLRAERPRAAPGGANTALKRETGGPDRTIEVLVDPKRDRAIQRAVLEAEALDTVVLAGKGHEDYQIIGTTKRHFDDREHAAAALARWNSGRPNISRT